MTPDEREAMARALNAARMMSEAMELLHGRISALEAAVLHLHGRLRLYEAGEVEIHQQMRAH